MEPTKAINILENATQNLAGTRADHLAILAALNSLKEFVQKHDTKSAEEVKIETPPQTETASKEDTPPQE